MRKFPRLLLSAALSIATALTARADHIYVGIVNMGDSAVWELSSEQPNTSLSGIPLSGDAGAVPLGVAFSPAGNLYVVDGADNIIFEYAPTGTLLGEIGLNGINSPVGLAFDRTGNLYVSYLAKNTIEKFSPAGADLGAFATANLSQPAGLAFDSAGNLYVANHTPGGGIEKFSSTGAFLGQISSASLSSPNAVAFDRSGNLYVANWGANTIERFSASGVDLGAFVSTGLNEPADLAFDSSGNLFVTNVGSDFIEKFSPTGTDLGLFDNFSSGYGTPYFMAMTDDSGNPLALPPVPEPATGALAAIGAMLLAMRRRTPGCRS